MSTDLWQEFYGPNAGYVIELYERYRRDPNSVDAPTRALFERWTPPLNGAAEAATVADVDLREVAGGWRFYTRDVCAPVVERFVTDGQQARLTQAAMAELMGMSLSGYRKWEQNRREVSGPTVRACEGRGARTIDSRG